MTIFRPKPSFLRWTKATRKPFIIPAARVATSWKVLVRTNQFESSQAICAMIDAWKAERQASEAKPTSTEMASRMNREDST